MVPEQAEIPRLTTPSIGMTSPLQATPGAAMPGASLRDTQASAAASGKQASRQAIRLRRFLMASSVYAISLPLLYFAHVIGLIAAGPALVTAGLMAGVNGLLYLMFRTGLNLRFADPSLTWLQTAAASVVLLFVVYSFDRERNLALFMCLVVFLFGAFRFTIREFMRTVLEFLAGYALVINLLMWFKPDTVNVYLEWFQWAALGCVLPCYAVIGGRLSELRTSLRRSNNELSSALDTIQELATHDSLTGLPNRAMFAESLQHALAQGERHERRLAVFFLDLDRFKNINDTLGHLFGDKVLKEAAARLSRSVRNSDIVARLGGDEFVVLVEEFGPDAALTEIGQKLLGAMSQPAVVEGHEISISASVGICIYPEEGQDAQTLLTNSDIAMYRAKAQGGNSLCFYSAEMNSHSLERLALEAALRRALERDELRVYYQPKMDVASGRMTGVEALLRWEHPELGLLAPDKFIPIAEETGLIVPIGQWVIRTVCERARVWEAQGMPAFSVAVNLSARQFRQERLVADLEEILHSTGTAPGFLELEITESMVMQDPEQATRQMDLLRRMGVRLAIDDFGTGYSSLAYLKRFPINSLKIDKAFVRDLPHDSDDLAITRAIIAMAHSLRLNVIAEGVEHRTQLDQLGIEGCDEFQGYFCRPPMTEADLCAFVALGAWTGHLTAPPPAGAAV